MPLTPSQARAEIESLVAQFRANEAALQNEREAMIESVYIRPLFRALNWNVDNVGLSPARAEFALQRTDERGKKPDYILRLEGNDLLVMDAKKVKYDMGDPRWLNQVYAYAYSTQGEPMPLSKKIDFAILTDFQEFVVLDCTLFAARPEAVANFRVLDWRYEDYVTRFDELWELFERNNVLAASRARETGLWARKLSPKKVKANRIPPDKAFLAALDDEKTGWRVRLAKDMKKHNPALGGEVLTAATQLVIDRLMFIKVLSDREIEDDYLAQLAELVARDGLSENHFGWFAACRVIFSKLNQIYNGSIFEPRPELEAVTVSNKVVREIIDDLLPDHSPYNFSVLPVEILGTIYERFLGRVVHATDKQVRIEAKPEVRKAGGVFYTPQYIVNYIVAQTVGKLLGECKTPEDVAQLKIVDPACGSGSFLLGAYEALIEWHEKFYADKAQLARHDRDAAYFDADGRVRLTAKLKRQILLNNIFGVDIDAQAVEVTRLSLSLKALEDTRRAELYEEVDLFHQRVLPDLARNIQCGNSLIGADYIFTDAAELKRVRPFEWERAFPQGFASKPSRSAMITSLETSKVLEPRGFDAVIGNPPYIRIQALKEWAPLEVEIYKKNYAAAGAGNYDIYVVFVEKALALLNARGRMGFILPHKFFNSQYGEPLRRLIVQGKHLAHIVHFGDQQIFAGATTYTALLFLDKQGNDTFEFVRVKNLEAWRAGEMQERGEIEASNVTAAEWNFSVGSDSFLFERLSKMPTTLGDIAERIAQGIRTSANEVYVLDLISEMESFVVAHSKILDTRVELERDFLLPFLQGREIKSYRILSSGKLVIIPYILEENRINFISETEMKKRSLKLYQYLLQNKKYLEEREHGKMSGQNWYAYVYPKNLEVMKTPKILVPDIADRASFAFDELGRYAFTSGYGIILQNGMNESPKYILGLLNSKVLDFYIRRVSTPLRGGFFRYFTQFLSQLPIRLINFSDPQDAARHEKMVMLVERMLTLQQHRASAMTQTERDLFARQIEWTDRAIDELVFELYEVNEEERAVVEGKT